MRPSSSPSDGLFAAIVARGPVVDQVSGNAWLRAMLDVEAALARVTAAAGLIPAEAGEAVTAACADTSAYDVGELAAAAALGGNPVIPLVRAVEQRAGAAGRYVHHGATSQDVLDTAMVLVGTRALAVLGQDLTAAVHSAAGLAARHRGAAMAGRTLLQQAAPTTFGLKAAGWGVALQGAAERVGAVRLPVQLGGAAGTLASYAGRGAEVARALAVELDLEPSVLPWHTARLPIADLAGALATAAGVVAKVALDVVLLAQTEVAEVAEGAPGSGGSSAMPHKRNPVAAVQARAAARRAPGLAATLYACMEQEHERAAGAWHAEWTTLSDLLATTGSAVSWLRECLRHLQVDPARMRSNLGVAGDDVAAAALADVLTARLGRARAHEVVRSAVWAARGTGVPLREVLHADPEVVAEVGPERLDELLDPAQHVGEAGPLVDAALASLALPAAPLADPRSDP
jgi:3-carboxy-cis,cis-muconate cycloisomerase